LSNALLEAMSTGLACVASNIVGMGEALRHGHNGLLFPSGDAGALSDSILELLADDDKRSKLGKQARETIMERFSIDTVADRYASLYTRLLGPAEKIAGRSGRTVEK
jgi:glycosyltransferase involved in cell wall biosynthesis